ncbi:hypothetical protein [Hymenobacter sp. AT01-02]|uniref:hypothetical protein n=1 Tax=Hymenobacter sp. AT01-02 TaxID=1571877 RepID=UPI00128F7DA7|nr:hypothetical protein [Hymenobacter sp. AT01-02]
MAQLYSRTSLTDSVAFYQKRAEAYATTAVTKHVLQVNQLAAQITIAPQDQDRSLVDKLLDEEDDAVQSNVLLRWHQLPHNSSNGGPKWPQPDTTQALTEPQFARFYHAALLRPQLTKATVDTSFAPVLTALGQHPGNAPYLDQLTFLRAYTQHYGGRPVAAQATLTPLATGSSIGTAYYQHLQGLWLLEQHLPALAAGRLEQARQNGNTAAALPAAYALALTNQPDSARHIARQLIASAGSSASSGAATLLAILDPDFRNQYTQAPDSLRVQYLVVRGDELPAADILTAAQISTTPTGRNAALLAQLPRAIRADQLSAVAQVLQKYAPAVTTPQASPWNVLRGELYARQRNWTALRDLTRTGTFTGLDRGWLVYFQAAVAEAERKPEAAARLYAQVVREAPYVDAGVAAAANFHTTQRDFNAAYNTLLRGIEYDPESTILLKEYILAAIAIGLNEYTIVPLEHLGALLSPEEYATFRSEVAKRRDARAASGAPWN